MTNGKRSCSRNCRTTRSWQRMLQHMATTPSGRRRFKRCWRSTSSEGHDSRWCYACPAADLFVHSRREGGLPVTGIPVRHLLQEGFCFLLVLFMCRFNVATLFWVRVCACFLFTVWNQKKKQIGFVIFQQREKCDVTQFWLGFPRREKKLWLSSSCSFEWNRRHVLQML